MTTHQRRSVLVVIVAVGSVLLATVAITAAIVMARNVADTNERFQDFVRVSDARDIEQNAYREQLNKQLDALSAENDDLSRQVKALTKALRDAGINPDDVVESASTGNGSGSTPSSPTTKKPSGSKASRPTPSKPATKPPAPAPAADPIKVCLPLVGCLL